MILHDGQRFRLESWGNGASFLLTHKPSNSAYFAAHGDDALRFESDMQAAEAAFPNKSHDEIAAWLWDQCDYGSAAQPAELETT